MKKLVLSLAVGFVSSSVLRADLVNHFTFDDPDNLLKASVGGDGVAYIGGGQGAYRNKCEVDDSNGGLGQLSATSLSGVTSPIRNGDALRIPSTGIMAFDQLVGSDAARSWCMVMRFQPPTKCGKYYCLYSLDQSNGGDGYLFIKDNGNGFGGSTGGWDGYPSTSTEDGIFGAWNTMMVCCDVENSKLQLYVNGELLQDRPKIGNNSLVGKPKVMVGADNDGEDALFYVDDVKFYNEAYPSDYFASAGTIRTDETAETYDEATVKSSVKPVHTKNGTATEFVFRADGSISFAEMTFATAVFYDAKGAPFKTEPWGVVMAGDTKDIRVGDAEKVVVTMDLDALQAPYGSMQVDESGAGYVKYSWKVVYFGPDASSAEVFVSVVPQGEDPAFVKITALTSVTPNPISERIADLVPGTTYEYVLKVVSNLGKEMVTDAMTFTTLSVPEAPAPILTSTLGDVVVGEGDAAVDFAFDVAYAGRGKTTTTVKVQYGTQKENLDQEATVASDWIGKGSFVLSGLEIGKFYYVRFVADNGTETTAAPVIIFSTSRQWTLGAAAGTLTDGSWVIRYTKDDSGAITLTQVVTPAANPAVFDISNPYVQGDDGTTWRIETMGRLFGSDGGTGNLDIKEVYLPSTLKTIVFAAFKNCFNLRIVYPFLPDSVEYLGGHAFWGCVSLTGDLRIGCGGRPFEFDREKGNHFDADNDSVVTGAVTSVMFGPEVTEVPVSFCWSQQNLTNITFLGNKVTSIGAKAFYNCSALQTVEPFFLPSITNFGGTCFSKCLKLSGKMTIGGVDSPARIDKEAFDSSSTYPLRPITSIIIRKNVVKMGQYALYGMGTEEVVFEGCPEFEKGEQGSFGRHQPAYSKYFVPRDNADWQAIYENTDYVTPLADVSGSDKDHLPTGKLPYGLAKPALFGVKVWLYLSRPNGLMLIVR